MIAMLLAATSLPAHAEPGDAALGVEAVGGSVSVEHLGTTARLRPGDRLRERDVVRTGADGRLSLRFAGLGFFELGPDAEIGVEKLPFAGHATDRNSIVSLSHGYLRVVWNHLSTRSTWPLYVYFGGHRAGLDAGEYFFDQREPATRVCIAAGQAALVSVTGENVAMLPPPSCTRLSAGAPPQSWPRDPEDWFAMRRDYAVDASAKSRPLPAPTMQGLGLPPLLGPVAELAAAPPRPLPLIDLLATESLLAAVRPAAPTAVSAPLVSGIAMPPATPQPRPAGVPIVAAKAAPLAATASVAKTVPPAVPVPADTGGEGLWNINLGSYPDAAVAAQQAQRLLAAGYPASVQSVQVRGQTWHRVQLRGLATADAARAKAAEVEQKLGLHGLWVMRQP